MTTEEAITPSQKPETKVETSPSETTTPPITSPQQKSALMTRYVLAFVDSKNSY
jgi:hypothetical protein